MHDFVLGAHACTIEGTLVEIILLTSARCVTTFLFYIKIYYVMVIYCITFFITVIFNYLSNRAFWVGGMHINAYYYMSLPIPGQKNIGGLLSIVS
jgi:hypothetical protein